MYCFYACYAVCDVGGTKLETTDCQYADYVGISTAYDCSAADANGNCTEITPFVPTSVKFNYARTSTTSEWILKSAYPSTTECPH